LPIILTTICATIHKLVSVSMRVINNLDCPDSPELHDTHAGSGVTAGPSLRPGGIPMEMLLFMDTQLNTEDAAL